MAARFLRMIFESFMNLIQYKTNVDDTTNINNSFFNAINVLVYAIKTSTVDVYVDRKIYIAHTCADSEIYTIDVFADT